MSTDPNACTAACTKSPDSLHDDRLKHLAAALRELSPEDRAKLAAMLQVHEGNEDRSPE